MKRRLGPAFAAWRIAAMLAEPAVRLLLRRRLRRGKELADRLGERRGLNASLRPDGRLIWLHAASVGETLSLLPLLEALCRLDPALTLLLTTATVSAQHLAAQRLAESGLDRRVRRRLVPLDVPRWVGRFLDHWRPDLAVLVESELWPNLIAGCVARDIALALVNARLSQRSARAWSRAGIAARPLFGAFDWITARSEEDASRLRALGAPAVEHDGDLKQAAAALPVDEAELARLRGMLVDRPVWLAASTHEGEEASVARLHRALASRHPGLLTVVAPRHPERGATVAALLDDAPRRGDGQDPDPTHGFWICDTLGELGLLYRLIDSVLLGNSLPTVQPPGGGHNPLEPARLGCAIAIGPLMQNFTADVGRLQAAGGLMVTDDEAALERWLDRMLSDPQARGRMAVAARGPADASAGLAERLAQRLLELSARPKRG